MIEIPDTQKYYVVLGSSFEKERFWSRVSERLHLSQIDNGSMSGSSFRSNRPQRWGRGHYCGRMLVYYAEKSSECSGSAFPSYRVPAQRARFAARWVILSTNRWQSPQDLWLILWMTTRCNLIYCCVEKGYKGTQRAPAVRFARSTHATSV